MILTRSSLGTVTSIRLIELVLSKDATRTSIETARNRFATTTIYESAILSCLQDQARVLYFTVKQLHYFNLQSISVDIAIALVTAVTIGKVYLAIAYAIDMTLASISLPLAL